MQSDRLTDEWTTTTLEAFGDNESVRKGLKAEDMYYNWAVKVYDEVLAYPDDYQMQIQGKDVSIKRHSWKRPYFVDVKGNLNKWGYFYIEVAPDGWLFNPCKTNDRVCHVCIETQWAIEYDRKAMIDHINVNQPITDNNLWKVSVHDQSIKSITRRFKCE